MNFLHSLPQAHSCKEWHPLWAGCRYVLHCGSPWSAGKQLTSPWSFPGAARNFFSGTWSISSSPSFSDLAACRALSHFLTPLFYNLSAGFLLLFLRTVITEALPLSRPMGLARTRLLCSLLEQTFFCNWQPWFLFTEATPAAPQSSKLCYLYGMKILLM